ncbi:MAG TPA: hypothetical protein VFY19_04650, partial [Geminicoccaceae bacterium]|nr:hypothetical protein [Geminicoccaceae bacterium]
MTLAARRDVLAEVAEVQGRSLWQDARRRLLRNRAAVVSMIVLALIAALALPQIAYIARLTRGSMIEVLHANYIRTARAKG